MPDIPDEVIEVIAIVGGGDKLVVGTASKEVDGVRTLHISETFQGKELTDISFNVLTPVKSRSKK